MRRRTLVLGSGISALSYLLYDRKACALGGSQRIPGGLAAMQSKLGPHFVWEDDNTRRLLSDLQLPLDTVEVRVGYLVSGEVIPQSRLTPSDLLSFKCAYSNKTRGTGYQKGHMSGGSGSFTAFRIGMDEVVRALQDAVALRVFPISAENVLLWDHLVLGENGEEFLYDDLVSTVSAPTLVKMLGMDHLIEKLKARDKTYKTVPYDVLPSWVSRGRESFEYAYVADPEVEYHRVRFMPDYVVLEFTGIMGTPGPNSHGSTVVKHPGGQIVGGGEVLRSLPPSVMTLGRYAQWQSWIKLNDVLCAVHGSEHSPQKSTQIREIEE